MSKNRVSQHQFLTLLFVCLFPLATERIPSHLSGTYGWLSPMLAGTVAAVLLAWFSRKFDPKADIPFGIVVPIMLWGIFLAAAHTARLGSRLAEALRASPVLVMAGVLILAAWIAAEGLPRFARSCEIFLMAIGATFVLILCFGLFGLEGSYFAIGEKAELSPVSLGAMIALGTLCAGCYGLTLAGDVQAEKGQGSMRFLILLFLALTGTVILILGRFGSTLMGTLNRPFFQMVSGLGLPGAFQRMEALISALWMVGDVSLLTMLLLSLSRLMRKHDGLCCRWILALVILAAAILFPLWEQVLTGELLPLGNLVAAGLILLGKRKKSKNLEKSA